MSLPLTRLLSSARMSGRLSALRSVASSRLWVGREHGGSIPLADIEWYSARQAS